MTVTITGNLAALSSATFGVTGIAGAYVLIEAVHPDEDVTPGYGFTSSVVARPLKIMLTSGGKIPTSTKILASAALRPAGAHHRVTWVAPASTAGGAEVRVTEDRWIGPDGGTCDITDPALRVDAGDAPVLAGWPELPPVPVYSSEGLP